MHLEKRVLVSGGAGFLGSHLCEQLLAKGQQVLCVDNFFTGTRRNIEHLLDHKRFRAFAARRYPSPVRGSGRDLQFGVPGLTHSLQERPRADDQDQRHRRHQHAWACQAPQDQGAPGLNQRSLRRPHRFTRSRNPIGATSTRLARAPATTKASAAPRRYSSTTGDSTACRSRLYAFSTPMAQGPTPTTAGWYRASSFRRCLIAISPCSATARRRAPSATWTI